MKFSVRQVFIAILSMVLTLGVLWIGQRLYRETAVTSPLVDTLKHVDGVKKATIHDGMVTVQLRSGANLMAVYRTVGTNAQTVLGHAPKSINVVNNANPALNALDSNMAFVVAQGEATGQFVSMQNSLFALARKADSTINVQMGAHHLYLTIRQGTHVIYQVLPVSPGGDKT